MEYAATDLEWLLDYQLHVAMRYLRFVSLVMATPANGQVPFQEALKGAVRDSDAVFDLDGGVAIIMAETALTEALSAVKRFKSLYDGRLDFRYGVGAFPTDGSSASRMLSGVGQRMRRAKDMGPGAVVFSD
ncbi:MAG: hypothetical protein NTW86_25490 [Candidatus Sumerlaeota bacterium]|nr:hypothetical protein [Candidatus Sumerlaeota bacterium]